MFDRFKRSCDLIKASAGVLKQDKHLLLFPAISAGALLLVVLAFALPVFGFASVDGLDRHGNLVYSAAFLFYVVQYTVIIYFNTALVGAMMIRLDGGSPTLGDGLRIANSRIGAILGYAVISATVGVILRAIQERVGFIGRIVVAFIGAGWAAATFLVVPVIAASDRGAVGSISDSVDLLKRTWGENIVGQAGMSAAFSVFYFALFSIGFVVIGLFAHSVGTILLTCAVLFVALLGGVLLHTTLSGIYSAALYRYATGGAATPGFDGDALASAFVRKD